MRDPEKQTVLVTGATGRQGGAVASRLLWLGHRVYAMTRRPESPAARALRSRGAQILVSDFAAPETYLSAMRECDAVFAMSTPRGIGTLEEIRLGKLLVDTARWARVRHLIFSSLAACDLDTNIAHFESKYEIERHIEQADVPWTVVAPVFFMENLLTGASLGALREGRLAVPLSASKPLQLIAIDDIGAFVAHVLENRERFLGRRIELASDELTCGQMATLLAETLHRRVRLQTLDFERPGRARPATAAMFEWLESVGFAVDIARLRRDYPSVPWHRFSEWVRLHDWEPLLGDGRLLALRT